MKKMLPRLIGLYLNLLAFVLPRVAARKGFNVFCRVRSAPVKDYHLAFFGTAEKFSFEFEGNKIQTYRWGNGPRAVLFLHGWQSHSFRWKKYIESMPKDSCTIYAMDAPAHGLSGGTTIQVAMYASAVTEFIRHTGPIDTIVAHSFGGFAVLCSLYEHADLPVKKLVMMGVPGEMNDFIQYYQKMLGISARTMRLIDVYFEKTMHHERSWFSSARFAAGVSQPALIVHDEMDVDAPYRYGQRLHALWKNSRMITTSGIGHNLKSPEIQKKVIEFVNLELAQTAPIDAQT